MDKKRRGEQRPPTTADAFRPPRAGAAGTKIMVAVLAVVAVCAVIFVVAVSLA